MGSIFFGGGGQKKTKKTSKNGFFRSPLQEPSLNLVSFHMIVYLYLIYTPLLRFFAKIYIKPENDKKPSQKILSYIANIRRCVVYLESSFAYMRSIFTPHSFSLKLFFIILTVEAIKINSKHHNILADPYLLC